MLRWLGCRLPLQWWYADDSEKLPWMERCAAEVGATLQDCSEIQRRFGHGRLCGFARKPYSIYHAPFEQVMLLDADVMCVRDPTYLFDDPQFIERGSLFWPDFNPVPATHPIWHACGIKPDPGMNFQGGQQIIDRARCEFPLSVVLDMNFDADYWYKLTFGEQDTYRMAWLMVGYEYGMIPGRAVMIPHTIIEHDRLFRRVFQHRCGDKWRLDGSNMPIEGFWFEGRARMYLAKLREIIQETQAEAARSMARTRHSSRESQSGCTP